MDGYVVYAPISIRLSSVQFENPHWDHLWECFANVVSADVLFRRYCWPKKMEDAALSTAFVEGIRPFAYC